MIFYFSGTGNSLYVAQKLAAELNDRAVNMAQMLRDERHVFKIGVQETVGFVFPVYFCGLPLIVRDFISKLRFDDNTGPYVYAVITCGSSIAACDKQLGNALDDRRIELNCVFDLKMPDNYIVMYNPSAPTKQKKIIAAADKQINKIIVLVKHRSRKGYHSALIGALMTDFTYALYKKHGRPTKKFYADYNCVGCGRCEKVCPANVIEMYKNKPRWKTDYCMHCTACINGCPKKALQYGNSTSKRIRYLNDITKIAEVSYD